MTVAETFRNSAKIVLRFFGINIQNITEMEVHPENFHTNLSAYVGITGNPSGLVSMEMEVDTCLKIASVISTNTQTSFENISKEIIREIINQISGNALTELWQHGYDSDMTPPSIITGDKIVVHHSKRSKEAFFLMDSDCGKIILKTFLSLN